MKIDTPMANAPIVSTELPKWPAIIVPAIPIMGTVMLEMMLGMAIRNISRFIPIILCSFKCFCSDKDTKYKLMFVNKSFFGDKRLVSCNEIASILSIKLLNIRKIMYLCAFKLKKL